ncbi:MAG: lipopolysaccharide biosynthesis protein RfbH [Candidatus Aenigmarchaeota archaeon]|nr:lipopolysaccharide biosynthesis protein RfbH [Candidatus Aenigmarchaeota archaeon]MDI6722120.1 lipopolysaccharide biosynthesis protein RfbH [Candidatus Aenigmarchaeota archaeon]
MNEIREKIRELISQYYRDAVSKTPRPKIPASGKVFDEKEMINAVDAVLDGVWTHGRFAIAFEKNLSSLLGASYCMITNSGSSANLLAISSLFSPEIGLKRGDEIITAAAAFPTTVNPIVQNGAVPVFVDIKEGTYNIDENLIEDAITDKTKAIISAHTLGNPFNLDKVTSICKKYNLFLIEDCCDALGARYNGKYVSSFGDLATFSFYPAHQITMGEGGAVATSNDALKRAVESIRDWGRDCWCMPGVDNTCGKRFSWQLGDLPEGYDHKYTYSRLGYNLKATDMQAAIGLAQLEKLPSFIEKRRNNFNTLKNHLSEFENYFSFAASEPSADPCWFGFVIKLRKGCPFRREEITGFLEKNGIVTRLIFAGNIVKQPYFKNYGINYRVSGPLKNSDDTMLNAFWIGVYPGITENDINYIYMTFKKFLSDAK